MNLITRKLKTMIEAANRDSIRSKYKAITAFFPYAVWRERDGQHELLGMLFRLCRAMTWGGKHEVISPSSLCAMASERQAFMWRRIEPLVATLLSEESPISLKQAVVLASPYLPWKDFTIDKHLIQLLAVAASAVPYTNDIGQSVVDTLSRIANDTTLQPHIPVGMWSWLNRRPSLPPVCWGRLYGSTRHVARAVRALRDIEILNSYLFLIRSEWDGPRSLRLGEVYASLSEGFSGIRIEHHRQDLLRRLDYVLGPDHLSGARYTCHQILE